MHFGIIAAGEGSRLAKEGMGVSKPLIPICGEPMIGRLINIYLRLGAETINVVTNEFMTDVHQYLYALKDILPVPLNIKIKTTPSSMHTFHELSSLFPEHGRFVVTTVDTIFREADFRNYVETFEKQPESIDGLMAVTDFIDDEKPLYVEVDAEMRITAFLDNSTPESRFVSGGIYGLDRKATRVLDKCLAEGQARMRNFQRALISDGLHLKAFNMGKIVDVDHVGDVEKAEAFLKA